MTTVHPGHQANFRSVELVLEQLARGMAWETVIEVWEGRISAEAVGEAVRLAGQALVDHAYEYLREPPAA